MPDPAARANAADIYRLLYLKRTPIGMQAPYFSQYCAPGRALDERLADPPWAGAGR